MARFFKHVGEHSGKKVVLVQRAIPDEEHMCSVIYSEIIPTHYHDDIMRVLESPEGQDSDQFWEVLRRRRSSTGNNLLEAIAIEGYLKKAPVNQVIVKPNAKSSIRLDELNKLLREAGQGDEAVRKLEELDRQQGYYDTRKINADRTTESAPVEVATDNSALNDVDLAQLNIKQSQGLKAQAEQLLAEATRLESEAHLLDPSLAPKKRGKTTSAATTRKSTAAGRQSNTKSRSKSSA